MASTLVAESHTWHTPVIGAYLLWRFTKAYQKSHTDKMPPIVLNHFLALAILTDSNLHPHLFRCTGIPQLARRFRTGTASAAYYRLHDRVRERLPYTVKAINIAVAGGFLKWDVDRGTLTAKAITSKDGSIDYATGEIATLGARAEVLGKFFAKHPLSKTAEALGVVF